MPPRFTLHDAFNEGVPASGKQYDASQCRDDEMIVVTPAVLRPVRCHMRRERSSHHADRLPNHGDRSPLRVSASDVRPRRSSMHAAHASMHRIAFVPVRCRMRRAHGHLVECGHHIAATRGAIRRSDVDDRLITGGNAGRVSVGSSVQGWASSSSSARLTCNVELHRPITGAHHLHARSPCDHECDRSAIHHESCLIGAIASSPMARRLRGARRRLLRVGDGIDATDGRVRGSVCTIRSSLRRMPQ